MAAINFKMVEQCVAGGKAETWPSEYMHVLYDDATQTARSEKLKGVKVIKPVDCPGSVYYLPTPKSPHGVDVDPTGEFIVAGGKLATVHPGALVLEDAEGDRRQGVRRREGRHPDLQVRSGELLRSPESGTRSPAHGIRRPGPRLHVGVHLVGDREVHAAGMRSRRPGPDVLLDRAPDDSGWRHAQAVREVRDRAQQDHEGPLSPDGTGAGAGGAAVSTSPATR